MRSLALAAAIAATAALAAAGTAAAATFRWASDVDSSSMDPYAREETFLLSFDSNIYEPLVRRDKDLKLEPALALSWTQTSPTVWRFELRRNVRFQDGTPFTADDVLFSFDRVRDGGSSLKDAVAAVTEARRIDDFTVDFVTGAIDPILPQELAPWDIMSKLWCEKNDAVHPADLAKGEESYATNHANGTGPFALAERDPEGKTVLARNPTWWDRPQHDLDRVEFRRIANPSARVAALLSGEVDMIYAVPPQEVERIAGTNGFRIVQGPELRTVYLGFDQWRPELLDSDVKGRNPFRDRRVRQAFSASIDEDTIAATVMRGQAQPTALLIGPGVNGFTPALNRRFRYDPESARRLLAEAGYPNGFAVGMDCPNDRYVNDEQICRAIVGMLAKIGVRATLLAQTRAKFFAKILAPSFRTSFFLLGWTRVSYDAEEMLVNVVHTRDLGAHLGYFNVGGYSNPEADKLVDAIQVETDQKKRTEMIHRALEIAKDDFAFIPLHQQTAIWATKDTVHVAQQADNHFQLRYVTVK